MTLIDRVLLVCECKLSWRANSTTLAERAFITSKESQSTVPPGPKHDRPRDLHRVPLPIPPVDADVITRLASEVVRPIVPVRQVQAGAEADQAPGQLRGVGQRRGEAGLEDRLAEQALDPGVEAFV